MNLVSDPWISVLFTDGKRAELGLRDLFARAGEIADVEGDAPHVRVALLRLLLAILHRALRGPRDDDEWERLLWRSADGFKIASSYLEEKKEAFELFDPDRPFWQCADLPRGRATPVATLVPSLASGHNRVWFDHTHVRQPARLSAAEAARWLVALQAFDPGGLKTGYPAGQASAEHAPLAGLLVVMPEGPTVARTLALNAVSYDPANELPFAGSTRNPVEDCPVWERDPPFPAPDIRGPTGYVDWLTWPSRRVLLVRDDQTSDVVDRVVITPGDRLPEELDPQGFEPFVPRSRRSDKDPFAPLRFDSDRAAWRHGAAILARRADPSPLELRAKVVERLDRLLEAGKLERDVALPLVVAGLAVDRAKLIAWGEERLSPLAAALADEVIGDVLAWSVQLAEDVQKSLEQAVAKALGRPSGNDRDRKRAYRPALPLYFALLGLEFDRFLLEVARNPAQAACRWSEAIQRAIDETWAHAVPSSGSASVQRMVVLARCELDRETGRKLASFRERVAERAEVNGCGE